MPEAPIVKRIFNTGEVSPKVYGRTDLARYEGAVKTMQDFVPLPQGGIVRRPGTEFIFPANNTYCRLVPFVFSTTQAYILEISPNQITRVFKDGGVVTLNNNTYEFVTPYVNSHIPGLAYAQSYDTLYVVHHELGQRKITRTAHNNWTVTDIVFNNAPAEWGGNNGFPRAMTFFQDRAVFASSNAYPSRIWFSQTSNYENMTQGSNDADGFQFDLLSGTSDVVWWLASHKQVIAGGDSGVWSIAPAAGANAAITPTNRRAHKDTYFGSSNVQPALLGDHLIYPQYLAGKIRDLSFTYESDSYNSSELSVLSDHLLEGYTIDQMAYQSSPFEIVWMKRSDGRVLSLTYLAEHKVVAFAQHTFSGGNVVSLACIPGNLEDELWLAVNRTIGGNNVTYIERMRPFYQGNNLNTQWYLDCAISGSANSNNVGGLTYLADRDVQYLADGVCGNAVVDSGAISISNNSGANNLLVGLGYTSIMETLPIESEQNGVSTMFSTKRITEIHVRARNSAGGTYGPTTTMQTPLFNNSALFSGDKTNLSLRGGHNTHKTVVIKQHLPLPLSIDALGLETDVGG